MGILFAVAGLAGAGKTTATDHLESVGAGRRVYVGQFVLEEVGRRGMQVTPESERLVRVALRRDHPHAVAALGATLVKDILDSGINVLLDAIFNIEEYRFWEQLCGDQLRLVAIAASFDIRAERLQHRSSRGLTQDQLKARDQTELNVLRLDEVLAVAPYKMVNEGTLDTFKRELELIWRGLRV